MDFESILRAAKDNQNKQKEPSKFLSTKFKPPTKEQRDKAKVLSDGVQKFLARKQEEEARKKVEAERKREELSALRALDPKANKRIQTMLKRTKSANKSVMEDAVDANNTADTLAGPSQPDEDDYGFVSETSSAMYDKLLKKMYSTPSDDLPKFAPSKKPSSGNLMSTKERVKQALIRQEEEERLPHKRKRRKKENGEEDEEGLSYGAPERPVDDDYKKEPEKPKIKRPPAPPPMDFMEILKLAEQKQHEPIVVKAKSKEEELEQPMTKKQKEEHRKYIEWKRQRDLRLKAQERGEVPPGDSNAKPTLKRIPKVGQTSSEQRDDSRPSKPAVSKPAMKPAQSVPEKTKPSVIESKHKHSEKTTSLQKPKSASQSALSSLESETAKIKRERDELLRLLKEKEEAARILEQKERLIRERDEALAKLKLLEEKELKSKIKAEEPKSSIKVTDRNGVKSGVKSSLSDPSRKPVATPSKDIKKPEPKPREFPPKDVRRPDQVKSREFPPKDVRRSEPVKPREFPPRDVRGVPKNGSRPLTKEQLVRKKLAELKKRRIADSDEDYDSELDDFIDDGPDPNPLNDEVSQVISQIFRYDKNKYSRYDEGDCDNMESNFAQISKEEYYSTKCGILEDLQDIQAEKEAIARKKKKGKQK